MGSRNDAWDVENEIVIESSYEPINLIAAHNLSSSFLRKKSDLDLGSNMESLFLRGVLINLHQVIFGTKISILFVAIPFAIVAQYLDFERYWVFTLSLIGLVPLAERISFLTESIFEKLIHSSHIFIYSVFCMSHPRQIACYTGPTVGGLLNATCGNATELIIAILALYQGKMGVLKYSLLGSILSNLLLVLGSSLFCGGLANLTTVQTFDKNQANVNVLLLLLGVLCHSISLFSQLSHDATGMISPPNAVLLLSRVCSIVLLVAYIAYIFFQLKIHHRLFNSEEVSNESDEEEEHAVISFWSALTWLVAMTVVIALLSEFVVGTIEDASMSWGTPISFLSIILLPIVGNAAEHAGAIIFAYKNKLDISLGVALGSATQISIFVVPLCVIVAWIMHIKMDLSLSLVETGCLAISVLITAFVLRDGSSHYMKGGVLLFAYIIIASSFFILPFKTDQGNMNASSIGSLVGFYAA